MLCFRGRESHCHSNATRSYVRNGTEWEYLDKRDGTALEVAAFFNQVEELRNLFLFSIQIDKAARLIPASGQYQGCRCRWCGELRQQQSPLEILDA